tara:strand:- start:217 stop:756 length:540 start_codon:yes stop_codon:yes gene_type:complete
MNIIGYEIQIFDYFIIGLTILFIIYGIWKGFINSVLSLLSWIGSIFITIISFDRFSTFITNQIIKIEFFSNLQPEIKTVSTIISIPIIFLISLFLLKRIRKFLSSDLDKQLIGVLIDKIFGILYGFIFSYAFFSAVLFFTDKIEFLNFIYNFLIVSSNILDQINIFNVSILEYFNKIEE